MINLQINTNIDKFKNPDRKVQIQLNQIKKEEFINNVSEQDEKYKQINSNININNILKSYERKIKPLPSAMKCSFYDIYNYMAQYLLIKDFIELLGNDLILLNKIMKNSKGNIYKNLFSDEIKTLNETKPLCDKFITSDISKQDFDNKIENIVNDYIQKDSKSTKFITN